MPRFTRDNTEGYSAADLACLNYMFEMHVHDLRDKGFPIESDDIAIKSLLDRVAEQTLAAFDAIGIGPAHSRIWQ